MSGRFIVIEGLDGVGKSSICKALTERLRASGRSAILVGKAPRRMRSTITYVNRSFDAHAHYLFYLSFVAHLSKRIKRVLRRVDVVCDRYIETTLAYHRARGVSSIVDIEALQLKEPDFAFM